MQAQKLEETKSNLQALLQFVEDERNSLAASEEALSSLEREYEQLRPLVESDRKTIDALFTAQEASNQTAQSTERWIGFAFWSCVVSACVIYLGRSFVCASSKSNYCLTFRADLCEKPRSPLNSAVSLKGNRPRAAALQCEARHP